MRTSSSAPEQGDSLALRMFFFANSGGISVAFNEQLSDNPQAWQFWQKKLDQNYMLALATKRESDQPELHVELRSFFHGQRIS